MIETKCFQITDEIILVGPKIDAAPSNVSFFYHRDVINRMMGAMSELWNKLKEENTSLKDMIELVRENKKNMETELNIRIYDLEEIESAHIRLVGNLKDEINTLKNNKKKKRR